MSSQLITTERLLENADAKVAKLTQERDELAAVVEKMREWIVGVRDDVLYPISYGRSRFSAIADGFGGKTDDLLSLTTNAAEILAKRDAAVLREAAKHFAPMGFAFELCRLADEKEKPCTTTQK